VSSKILDFLSGADEDDPTRRRHAHTCSACGHVFVHDPDACIGDGATSESCAIAHVCPRCGHVERHVDVDASEPEALAQLCPIDGSPAGATCPKPPPTYASNGRISDLDAEGFRYTGRDPPMGAGPLDSLLGLVPQAQEQAQGLLSGAATQAGQAGGKAAGDSAAQAIAGALPGIVEAVKAQIPGLVQTAGAAAAPVVTPIANQAGQTAGQAAAGAVRENLDAEKGQVADALKVGGMIIGGAAVVGAVVWALWPKSKKKGG
jgi:hypothetical protein